MIEAGFMREPRRHDVTRIGEREPIPTHVRAAIWYRDRGKCEWCPPERKPNQLHVDHIIPWSAGGPDTTDNLRLLCAWHNETRSNWVDHGRPKRPATWWCHRCFNPASEWRYVDGRAIHWGHENTFHKDGQWLAVCRVTRGYDYAISRGETPDWHDRQRVTTETHIAYCAHCNLPGLTAVVL